MEQRVGLLSAILGFLEPSTDGEVLIYVSASSLETKDATGIPGPTDGSIDAQMRAVGTVHVLLD